MLVLARVRITVSASAMIRVSASVTVWVRFNVNVIVSFRVCTPLAGCCPRGHLMLKYGWARVSASVS